MARDSSTKNCMELDKAEQQGLKRLESVDGKQNHIETCPQTNGLPANARLFT